MLTEQVYRLAGDWWEDTGLVVEGGQRAVFPAPAITPHLLHCSLLGRRGAV